MRGGREATDEGRWRLVHVMRRRMPGRRLWPWALAPLVLIAALPALVLTTPLFAVDDVRVTGVSILDPADVAAPAEPYLDRSILRADLDAIAEAVAALAPVRSVEVSRSWPSALRIAVTERQPYLAVPTGDETFLMVDSEGVVFDETAEIPDSIWNVELAAPGPADLATSETIEVLRALPGALATEVERVAAPSPAGITLYLDDGRTLVWGDASENDAKTRVATHLLATGYEHVDVSAPDAPTVS